MKDEKRTVVEFSNGRVFAYAEYDLCKACHEPMLELQLWGEVAKDLRAAGVRKTGSYQDESGEIHTACQECIDSNRVGTFTCGICQQKRDALYFGKNYGKFKLCRVCSGEMREHVSTPEYYSDDDDDDVDLDSMWQE